MIRIIYTETGMEYKCSNQEIERVKKILPCVVSSDIDALYSMGLISTELFTDGRVLFKFEDDIILEFMMSNNPTIPYKNDVLQTYYCKIKLLNSELDKYNTEVEDFLSKIGDTKKQEDTPSFEMPDDYHIIYKGKEYEILYTNTCLEDLALQQGERAIIINDGNDDYKLSGATNTFNNITTKDPLVDQILEDSKSINQNVEFNLDDYKSTGENIEEKVKEEENEQSKEK